MVAQNNIRSVMQGHTLVPVVTFQDGDDPVAFMHFLVAQGVRCIEVTLRTAAGLKAIDTLKQSFASEVLVGAGTVTRDEQVSDLVRVQADFLVSPGLTPSLHASMEDSGIPYLPGVSTPSEVIHAMELGCDTLKFFPAHLFGGLDALKAYGQVFPAIQFCPTGGVSEATSGDYLALANVFAVGGSWFQKAFKG
jgi:2-dehydro-3-deoxyphosphogluconate aldolase/(4S)-4-hydroxy-2-oxoglutarate aldolase